MHSTVHCPPHAVYPRDRVCALTIASDDLPGLMDRTPDSEYRRTDRLERLPDTDTLQAVKP